MLSLYVRLCDTRRYPVKMEMGCEGLFIEAYEFIDTA